MPIAESPRGMTPPPARKPAAKKPTSTPSVTPEKVMETRQTAILEFFGIGSAVAVGLGQWADAATIEMHAPAFAEEGAKLAQKYEKVGAALDRFAEMAPVAGIAATGIAFLLQIATNHKLVSTERGVAFGATEPSLLESQMRTSVQKRVMAARAQAKREADERAALEREFQQMMQDEAVSQ